MIAFRAAFKVIIVAALAVSTRQLTLWIMIAAFSLLILEFVGASVFSFLPPESCTILLGSWIGEGLLGLGKQTPSAQQASVLPDSLELIDFEDDRVQEIQILESEFDSAGETQIEVEEMETKEKNELSRSGRIKSHLIKKLVSKKLRDGKKKNEDQWGADIHKIEELEEEEEILRADQVQWEESELDESKKKRWREGHQVSI